MGQETPAAEASSRLIVAVAAATAADLTNVRRDNLDAFIFQARHIAKARDKGHIIRILL